jgi:hypothetical protein
MSKRLQVLLEESEMREIRKLARKNGLTVAEWVRQVLRAARRGQSQIDPARKLEATRKAVRHSFPTGDIDQILEEIERGYTTGAPQ